MAERDPRVTPVVGDDLKRLVSIIDGNDAPIADRVLAYQTFREDFAPMDLAREVIASRTTIEALQARVSDLEGQCERSTVIECGWREQVRDMKPKMENAERKLADIFAIASNSDKRGWSDFDRIATLAKVKS
jgi:hypothetical protein